MAKWKASGPDLVHGYWLREFANLHETIAMQLDEYITTGKVPSWMTKERTCLILKDKSKGNIASNYPLITCLPLMLKLLTGMIAEEMYQHLLPDEQKGCRRNSRGMKDQLMIDKMMLRK